MRDTKTENQRKNIKYTNSSMKQKNRKLSISKKYKASAFLHIWKSAIHLSTDILEIIQVQNFVQDDLIMFLMKPNCGIGII